MCGIPWAIAPDLFGDSETGCWVSKQPVTADEQSRMLKVLRSQEVDCIHYRGNDAAIIRRLAEAGDAHVCDHAPADIAVVLRNVVTFAISEVNPSLSDASRLLEEFSEYAVKERPYSDIRTKPIERRNNEASFALAWSEDHFHPMTIRPVDGPDRWLIVHRGNLGLSEFLDEWLRSTERFTDIRWYTEDAWQHAGGWQSLPW
ncbi:MAG TPA: ferredoxin [Vicinamibacterales bacterium]|nr:ferredoxin [Vicinamibacterales bacterium]